MNINTEWELSVLDVKGKLERGDDVLLLDVRQPPEYATVRIDGATLVPLPDIPDRLEQLSEHADREIITYCHHGGRSLQAAAFLRENGFGQVKSMAGGIDAWSVHIDPALPRY
jgi:adenylyltransferase/sulfurtransferase